MELKPNGSGIPVTRENVREYVDCYVVRTYVWLGVHTYVVCVDGCICMWRGWGGAAVSASKPTDRPTDRPTNNQPTNKTNKQTTNEPTNEPTNQRN